MKSVLICEDNYRLADEWSNHLSKNGYEVTSAYSAKEADILISKFDYDIFVVDLFFPSLMNPGPEAATGIEVLGRLGTKKFKHMDASKIVIAVSGSPFVGSPSTRSDSLKMIGADAFLEKPFTPRVLLETIESLALG